MGNPQGTDLYDTPCDYFLFRPCPFKLSDRGAFLEELEPKIEEAHDGQEAVDKFSASPEGYYAMILMDIQMPRLNGYEATRKIRDGAERQ